MQEVTVIVTGAGGFVGRHLVASLASLGHRLVAVDSADFIAPNGVRRVSGDIGSKLVRSDMFSDGCTALIHLATLPGGAAEAQPSLSRQINVNAMYDLLEDAIAAGRKPRIVYASSIAVFGDPLPPQGVDDETPLAPKMIYAGHKAMMEMAVAMLHNRGEIDAISVRLPGILARPKGPSGMKSAFMSDLFHALKAREPFECPTSRSATIWAQSVKACVENFQHALTVDPNALPTTRVVTLPAQRVTMGDLADEIARQCNLPNGLVTFRSDPALEAAFGAQPPLSTAAADRAGFKSDGSLTALVESALSTLA